MLGFFLVFSCAASGGEVRALSIVQPLSSPNEVVEGAVAEFIPAPVVGAGHLLRSGHITLDVDRLLPRLPVAGGREATLDVYQGWVFQFRLFPDEDFSVIVEKESRPRADVYTLNGRIEGEPLSSVSLVITQHTYLLTIEDLQRNRVFRVQGNTETGAGRVSEIDLTRLPPRDHLPPLIPPADPVRSEP